MNRRVVSDLLQGIVLTLSLFLAGLVLPVAGFAAALLTPAPIAYYFRKLGTGYGLLMLGAVVFLVVSAAGISVGMFFIAEFAAMGMALSGSVGMRLPLGRGVLFPTLASLAGSALLLLMVSSSIDKPLPQIIKEQVRENVKGTIEVYKKVGLPSEQMEGLTDVIEGIESLVLKAFPSLIFVGTLSITVLNLLILKGRLKKKGIEEYQVEPTLWQSPEPLVWLLIAGGVLLLIKNEWAGVFGLNLLILSGGIYLFQGMAIMAFYFKKMETPLFFRVLGYLLIFFQQVFTIMVIGLGLFDLWFDFRRLKQKEA